MSLLLQLSDVSTYQTRHHLTKDLREVDEHLMYVLVTNYNQKLLKGKEYEMERIENSLLILCGTSPENTTMFLSQCLRDMNTNC